MEATALSNLMLQLVSLGVLPSLEEGRRLIARQEALREFEPEKTEVWETAYQTYQKLLAE